METKSVITVKVIKSYMGSLTSKLVLCRQQKYVHFKCDEFYV